jgi:hypothetical protein
MALSELLMPRGFYSRLKLLFKDSTDALVLSLKP